MSIPLTRLGGHAFNHSPNNDAEAEYDRLRDLAREEARKRGECYDRSRAAYNDGDGAAAKQLSNEGKAHGAKMEQYNKQASEFIFRENNAPGRIADDTIDLHGQFVEEAEDILEERIRYATQHGQSHLHVIVGKGNHSVNHVQKIKPRVEQVCQELGLQYHTEENAGRIYINLTGGEAIPPPSGHYGGGGGGGGGYPSQQPHHGGQQQHHGGQQHGGQQHGGQQQGQDDVEKLIGKLVRKLGDCCTVM
ncbi:Smr domain protein [Microdochium trichocladiopsis]|uniref:Smr domain protein n=1 Tax=Microdochium trichocladiopsis TaxID=1682393 RepID=A0A9P8YLP5_9PEZI|nr:Smr domain protein [Microdochium trichocladiopsis]KAH7041290.1 Smr domain protein [Microdochium trichocladiopsis]